MRPLPALKGLEHVLAIAKGNSMDVGISELAPRCFSEASSGFCCFNASEIRSLDDACATSPLASRSRRSADDVRSPALVFEGPRFELCEWLMRARPYPEDTQN